MKKLTYLLFLIFAVCGCVRQSATGPHPAFGTLEHSQIVYIAVPKDVPAFDDSGPSPTGYILDDKRFPGTGARTASMMKDAFAPYASKVIVGTGYETLETVLANAKAQNARYIFVSEFDILMRRRIMWQPRLYLFRLDVKIFDALREGTPYKTGISISEKNEPSYRTEQEIETLKGPIGGV